MATTIDLPDQVEEVGPPSPPPPPPPPPPPADEWRLDKAGRQFANHADPNRRGVIYRQGDESVAQARERVAMPRDKRPRKSKTPKMPEAPRKADLKELERTLSEALKAPAIVCATAGDEWAANHFTTAGPYLARNLIVASEHNPWLRDKLEQAASGEDAMMMVVSLVSVGGALLMYLVPPLIYWFNLPVPHKTRDLLGIPDRRGQTPAYAADHPPETADTAEFPQAA